MPAIKMRGFTLVELIIGIIVFAIALSMFVSLMVPQAIKSVDPIFQVRAAELGQSLISEIASKPFDENSSRTGGYIRCNELNEATNITTPCSVIAASTNDRTSYDDVDDYNGLVASGSDIRNSLDLPIQTGATPYDIYQGFSVAVVVFYDDDFDGQNDGINATGNTKLITVTVTTPNDEALVFSTYRTNY